MFSCDDTFPIRQPHRSLSPNIKIPPSSDSPNFPLLSIGSPKRVTLVCTELPGPGGFPTSGSGLDGPWDKLSPCSEGMMPCAPQGWCSRRGQSLPGASSSQFLTHSLSPLLKGSCCQCTEDAAAATPSCSSFFTSLHSSLQKSQGPHPNPSGTQVVSFLLLTSAFLPRSGLSPSPQEL